MITLVTPLEEGNISSESKTDKEMMRPHSALYGMTTKQVTYKVTSKTQWILSPVARVRFGRPFLIPDFYLLDFRRATGALRR